MLSSIIVRSIAVLATVTTALCVADEDFSSVLYDEDDHDDRSDVVDEDDLSSSTAKAPFQWDDIIPNKCTDPSSGEKYKIGVTWYPDGCGRRTCFYSLELNMPLVHTEKCACKECPLGMRCSIVHRAVVSDVRYPQCCPSTVCVPERNYIWNYLKKEYLKDAFVKLQKKASKFKFNA